MIFYQETGRYRSRGLTDNGEAVKRNGKWIAVRFGGL